MSLKEEGMKNSKQTCSQQNISKSQMSDSTVGEMCAKTTFLIL